MKLLKLLTIPLMLNPSVNKYDVNYNLNKVQINLGELVYNRTEDTQRIDTFQRFDNNGSIKNICTYRITTLNQYNYKEDGTSIENINWIFLDITPLNGITLTNVITTLKFNYNEEENITDSQYEAHKYDANFMTNWQNSEYLNTLNMPSNPLEMITNNTNEYSNNYSTYPPTINVNFTWNQGIAINHNYQGALNTTTFLQSQEDIRNTNNEEMITFTNGIINFEWYGQVQQEYTLIDVHGLLAEILFMPFTFFSGFFNLTIFPDSPIYRVNIGHIILSLIALLAIIKIVGMIRGKL